MQDGDIADTSKASDLSEASMGTVDPLPLTEDSQEYFKSYEDVEIHRLMVSDKPRTTAYFDAITRNKHLFKDKIAMDVGAGTGILSLFMASAGAKKVYAVEASGMAEVIQKVAEDNGFGDVIQVFHSRVEDISLPEDEKVDIIVSEWMGFYLLHESMLNSVIKARDMFLSDEGTVFPSEARIFACPCSLQSLYKEQINYWDNVYGFNMSAVKQFALRSKMIKPEVCLIPESDLLSEPTCIKKFNLRWVTEEEVKLFSETTFVGITKSGSYQGLCLWFECDFEGYWYSEEGEEQGTLITLSTSPMSPPTHWKQTVVVLGYGSAKACQEIELSCQDGALEASEDDVEKNATEKLENHEPQQSDLVETKNYSKDDSKEDKREVQDTVVSTTQLEFENLVEKDEVVGWKIVFAQSDDNVRHYTMTVEMLDPEIEEHPVPCLCPMPRCVIIAKMIENDEMGEEDNNVIDCT
ncbi:protein arginine N-methyltransferase 1-like [Penaeus chinensis]|uniref:protein arginine N-methyltransferase 1-like n=1 Tax=Penaeus chinensis TaxID=139456 RepID=UPI001FB7F773|nr:protein arginine N-methyltransferase 1-like [Penaeus chinensis]XP_047500394.1 protein arginine N-methyltransferase 1-like [Penaeus chinensis]XP_047500395.1 protein arginine N-methyltransferase 1-like [Penaeus chinensis]XP_047500396.1 protein arginine N-methyltransferase 1-like [Penaeus chinensis]XP_047500397.1 protein arginine N-methyltransferase 1-like [Penaeus chinensis]XP_047500398.1 protein arginine N-methyltransferase 1-like [Penaeus chinensis]XP_047500399.1 protein arginine N-methylt